MNLFWQVESSLYTVISDLLYSAILATCLSLIVESPVLGLEKVFLKGKKRGSRDSSKEQVLESKKPGLKESLLSGKEA